MQQSFKYFLKHSLYCNIANYHYKYDGGCATSTELYSYKNLKLKTQNEESTEACYWLCETTSSCKYFEYDSNDNLCHLFHEGIGITRGNGYPNVKCYKMGSIDGKYIGLDI